MRILEFIAAVLVVLWLVGFILHIAGNLIHFLLIAAIIVLAFRFFKKIF